MSLKRHISMLFCQLVNVVDKTVEILVLSDDVDIGMCVLRSFAVFVIITVTITYTIVVAIVVATVVAAAAAIAILMTYESFLSFLCFLVKLQMLLPKQLEL